ncbi:hypothetical protein [Anabaena sp. 4-3]|nr:hypothetical protein [Anabaena sp. 4-3]
MKEEGDSRRSHHKIEKRLDDNCCRVGIPNNVKLNILATGKQCPPDAN